MSDIPHKLISDKQVGHEIQALTPARTLDSLYVQPLLQILERQNPKTQFTANISSTK